MLPAVVVAKRNKDVTLLPMITPCPVLSANLQKFDSVIKVTALDPLIRATTTQ
jgi:hypothetical protein